MSNYQHIKLSIEDGVAVLSLNRPDRLNSFSQPMRLELLEAVPALEQNDEVRVIVFTGEGRAFSAGADLTEGMPGHDRFTSQCEAEYTPGLMAVHDSSKIWIAAVNGACAGVGSAAALNCDMVAMADDAYFYQAFAAIGLMPDGGATKLFLEKLGYSKAFEMAVSAGKMGAEESLKLGLANKVFPAEELLANTVAWAKQLAQGAPLAQASVKQLMRRAERMSYQQVVEAEAVLQSDLIESEDARNAGQAFLDKKPIVFNGR
jgi:2-(1,2-epoxy-1,2-dihydrophenyl)acetyl-CoA isomerase